MPLDPKKKWYALITADRKTVEIQRWDRYGKVWFTTSWFRTSPELIPEGVTSLSEVRVWTSHTQEVAVPIGDYGWNCELTDELQPQICVPGQVIPVLKIG